MKKSSRQWMNILGLSLGLPGTVLFSFYLYWFLIENEIVSQTVALIIVLGILTEMFFLIIYYGLDIHNKNKSKDISTP